MPNANTAAESDGTEAYIAALGLAGTDQASASLVILPTLQPGRLRVYNLSSGGTTLTMALLASGLFRSENPTSTWIDVPTHATLGHTYDAGSRLMFPVQRGGAGEMAVNFAGGVTISDPNNLDPANMGINDEPVWVVEDGTDSWHYE